MIHEEIATCEVCKLAKEKGFDCECPMFYNPEGKLKYGWAYDPMNSGLDMRDMLCHNSRLPLGFGAECAAPTQSLLQRWLRDEKGIHIVIESEPTTTTSSNMFFQWIINYNSDGECYDCYNDIRAYPSYEKTLESALKFALENLI